MINRRSLLLVSISLVLPVASALAQTADDNNIRIRGVFQKLDGQTLTVQTADGNSTTLQVTADTVFTRNEPAKLSDIKAGDFVASAAITGADGRLHSTEVRIFPPAMAGLGEGQRPMQDKTKTMTNASVSEVSTAPEGQVLKVQFHGGNSELVVGPDVPVVRVVIAQPGDLTAGANVFVTAVENADNTLKATRVLAQ